MSSINPKITVDWLGPMATCDPDNCDHCLGEPDEGTPCIPWYRAHIVGLETDLANCKHETGLVQMEGESVSDMVKRRIGHEVAKYSRIEKEHGRFRRELESRGIPMFPELNTEALEKNDDE